MAQPQQQQQPSDSHSRSRPSDSDSDSQRMTDETLPFPFFSPACSTESWLSSLSRLIKMIQYGIILPQIPPPPPSSSSSSSSDDANSDDKVLDNDKVSVVHLQSYINHVKQALPSIYLSAEIGNIIKNSKDKVTFHGPHDAHAAHDAHDAREDEDDNEDYNEEKKKSAEPTSSYNDTHAESTLQLLQTLRSLLDIAAKYIKVYCDYQISSADERYRVKLNDLSSLYSVQLVKMLALLDSSTTSPSAPQEEDTLASSSSSSSSQASLPSSSAQPKTLPQVRPSATSWHARRRTLLLSKYPAEINEISNSQYEGLITALTCLSIFGAHWIVSVRCIGLNVDYVALMIKVLTLNTTKQAAIYTDSTATLTSLTRAVIFSATVGSFLTFGVQALSHILSHTHSSKFKFRLGGLFGKAKAESETETVVVAVDGDVDGDGVKTSSIESSKSTVTTTRASPSSSSPSPSSSSPSSSSSTTIALQKCIPHILCLLINSTSILPWYSYYLPGGHARHHNQAGNERDIDREALFWIWERVPFDRLSPLFKSSHVKAAGYYGTKEFWESEGGSVVWVSLASVFLPLAYMFSLFTCAYYNWAGNKKEILSYAAQVSCTLLFFHHVYANSSSPISSILYLLLSGCFSVGFLCHPYLSFWILQHTCAVNPANPSKSQPTISYYGSTMWNWCNFNILMHVEHHDFARIPWYNVPRLRAIAPEFYDTTDTEVGERTEGRIVTCRSVKTLVKEWVGAKGDKFDFCCEHIFGQDFVRNL